MSEDDDWNHRSQFKGPSDPGLKTVTANVKVRRHGEVEPYHPEGLNPESEPDEAPDSRDWEDEYDTRHFNEGRYDEVSDERSDRERLLAGETV